MDSKPVWQVYKHLVKQTLALVGRPLSTLFPFLFASEESRACLFFAKFDLLIQVRYSQTSWLWG